MIPVRVPATAVPVLASEREFTVAGNHPLAGFPCPVCDERLANGQPSVLVFVGIHPEDRKPAGWTTGAAVTVHRACAGPAAQAVRP